MALHKKRWLERKKQPSSWPTQNTFLWNGNWALLGAAVSAQPLASVEEEGHTSHRSEKGLHDLNCAYMEKRLYS